MRRAATALALATAAAVPQGQARAQAADTALASLVSAELAFAAQAAREGIRAAFIANLADGATMFTPDPVDGLAWSKGRAETGARLSWYPSHAGISAGGDLGFTTGPSEFRATPTDTVVRHGHFTSIWRRGADGVWKVELDLGTPHERPRSKIAQFDPLRDSQSRKSRNSAATRSPSKGAVSLPSLLGLDSAIAHTAAARGTAEAFDQFADPQVRILRPGAEPVTRRPAALRALRGEPGSPRWRPAGGGLARSGDLGYTWGAVRWVREGMPDSAGYYVRVWRWGPDGWRIVLDAVSPAPLRPASSAASPPDRPDSPAAD